MNLSVFAIALLSLGTVLATPPFLKDKNQCEELGCCVTTTVAASTTTGVPVTTTTDANAPTNAPTDAPTTTVPVTTTTVPVTTTTVPVTTTTTPAKMKEGSTVSPTTTTVAPTTTTTAPTCKSLNCDTVCGGDDGGESSGSHQILSIAVMAAGFFLSFLL